MIEEKEVQGKPSGNGQNYNEPALMEIFTRTPPFDYIRSFLFSVKIVVTGV
jgi:hypothetical protein